MEVSVLRDDKTKMNIDAIKARLGSISPAKRLKLATVSTAADRLLDDARWLVREVERLQAEIAMLNQLVKED